uniref:Class II heat shock protein n=1 Tax=Tanacetum cinerariifolium TaxID=118510 RepID=A0A6L2JI90_TANCI|nr:class II heat shock protein [Tanacetum cinerariifolium]
MAKSSSQKTSSSEIIPKEEPVTLDKPKSSNPFLPASLVDFTFDEITFTTNNEVSLLYPSHHNQDHFEAVSDFISKCCLKETFTRAPNQYKEYLNEVWYTTKILDESKVWISSPTIEIRGHIELTINPTQVFNVYNLTLKPNQPKEPPFTGHMKTICNLDVPIDSKAPKPSSQTKEDMMLQQIPQLKHILEYLLLRIPYLKNKRWVKTTHTDSGANEESKADDISLKVKLEDLSNILKDTRSAFFTLESLPNEPIIVSVKSEEEEEVARDKDTEATSHDVPKYTLVPPSPSPKPAQIQELMAQVYLLHSRKAHDLDSLLSLLHKVTDTLNRFAIMVENALGATSMNFPSVGKATALPAKGEKNTKDADTKLKDELVDLLGKNVMTGYYTKNLLFDKYCDKMLKRNKNLKITKCKVLTKKGPITLKIYREDGSDEVISNLKKLKPVVSLLEGLQGGKRLLYVKRNKAISLGNFTSKVSIEVKDKQEKDKIGTKPDKNSKRVFGSVEVLGFWHVLDFQIFSDQDAKYILSKLLQMGMVAKYQSDFEILINRVTGISENLIKSYYIFGLKPTLQCALLRSNPTNLDEAFSLASATEARFTDLQLWELLRSNTTTLGEAFFRARITGARFEDEQSTTAITKPNDLNTVTPAKEVVDNGNGSALTFLVGYESSQALQLWEKIGIGDVLGLLDTGGAYNFAQPNTGTESEKNSGNLKEIDNESKNKKVERDAEREREPTILATFGSDQGKVLYLTLSGLVFDFDCIRSYQLVLSLRALVERVFDLGFQKIVHEKLLTSNPTTLGEAFLIARITEACFEDEQSTITIAKPNDLNTGVQVQDLEEKILHKPNKVESIKTSMVATSEEYEHQENQDNLNENSKEKDDAKPPILADTFGSN